MTEFEKASMLLYELKNLNRDDVVVLVLATMRGVERRDNTPKVEAIKKELALAFETDKDWLKPFKELDQEHLALFINSIIHIIDNDENVSDSYIKDDLATTVVILNLLDNLDKIPLVKKLN